MSPKNVFGKVLHELNRLPELVLVLLLELVKKLTGNESVLWYEKLKLFLRGPSIMDSLVKKTSPSQIITVLPGSTLSECIDAGNYDECFCLSITEGNFPHDPVSVGDWECALFGFEERVSSQLVLLLIVLSGWQPATIEQLLTFGAKYPDEQCRYSVVGLGSICYAGDDRRVPVLWSDNTFRYLDLRFWLGLWDNNYRFLVVRPKN